MPKIVSQRSYKPSKRIAIFKVNVAILFVLFYWIALGSLTGNAIAATPCVAGPNVNLSVTQKDLDPFDHFSQQPPTSLRPTYTITVKNLGLDCATNVNLFDILPSLGNPPPFDVTFVSATPSQGSCLQASGTVQCTLGSITGGASATVEVKINVPSEEVTLTNTVNVFSDQTGQSQSVEETTIVTLSPVTYDFCGTFFGGNVSDCENADKVNVGQSVTRSFEASLGNVPAGTPFTVKMTAPFSIFDPSSKTFKSEVSFQASSTFSMSIKFSPDTNLTNTPLNATDLLFARKLNFDFGGGAFYPKDLTGVAVKETVPPAAVTNLATGSATANSVQLSWSAPGDDANTGTAASYDIRFATSQISEANWAAATQAVGEPAPLVAGSSQNFTVTGLICGTTYFFALKTADEVSNVSAISNSPSAATAVCPDLTPIPSVSINDVNVVEGNSGTTNAVFTVTLSAVSAQTVTANYSTTNGSATAGSDYVATSGTVTFNPGETTKNITVVVKGDAIVEPNENFFVNLNAATNATIADGQGVGTIINDDSCTFLTQPPIDFDGDCKSDVALYQSNSGHWFFVRSTLGFAQQLNFGGSNFLPVPDDYDGDGKTDLTVYNTTTGDWFVVGSNAGFFTPALNFGGAGFIPVPGDYDGDGEPDIAVYQQSTGNWFVVGSTAGFFTPALNFGGVAFIPVPGDYDGDGKTDVAVYHATTGNWFVVGSTSGFFTPALNFGGAGFLPVPGDHDGDGKADPTVYQSSTGNWFGVGSSSGFFQVLSFGGPGFTPVAGDYDGDGKTDPAVYQQSTGNWFVVGSTSGFFTLALNFGGAGFVPVLPQVTILRALGLL